MKACKCCKRQLPIAEFYKHSGMADGHLNFCKPCVRIRAANHRRNNEAVRERDRARGRTANRRASRAQVAMAWRQANPEKYKAQTAVGNAVRDGRLSREPCKTCGSTAYVHAHHQDYSKPLDVTWLCAAHHHRRHGVDRRLDPPF